MDAEDIDIPRSDTTPRPFLNPVELQSLLDSAKDLRTRALIVGMFYSGTRVSEFLNIDREAYEKAHITAKGFKELWIVGKNNKGGFIYFNVDAREAIDAYLGSRRDKLPFLIVTAHHTKMTVQRAEQLITECAAMAGLEKHVTPHIIGRHSYGTNMLNNGAPLYEVSKLMRHSNIQTTANIYGHFDSRKSQEALLEYQPQIG